MNAIIEPESLSVESGTIALLNRSEVDAQIATAHRFPRSIKAFLNEARELATLNENVAYECTYAVPRDGKVIEGPSARFAEIVLSAWGNCRSGARIVDIGPNFITAQGVCHDLQRNVAITFEVRRRITNRQGRRFNDDMIVVTGNAASSIALRNSILKVIPKAFWSDVWEEARRVARGDVRTLANRRAEALKMLEGYGVRPDQVFTLLEVRGIEDVTLDHLVTLRGIVTAIKEGDTTPEEAFKSSAPTPPAPTPPAPTRAAAPTDGASKPAPPSPPRPATPPRPAAPVPPKQEAQPEQQAPADDESDEPADALTRARAATMSGTLALEECLGEMTEAERAEVAAYEGDLFNAAGMADRAG